MGCGINQVSECWYLLEGPVLRGKGMDWYGLAMPRYGMQFRGCSIKHAQRPRKASGCRIDSKQIYQLSADVCSRRAA